MIPKEVIKIVELQAFKVVSFHVSESLEPESEASRLMNQWALKNELFDNPSVFQVYGFNNPFPGKKELRGYEFWVTIPDDFEPGNNLTVKNFLGGLYAVIRIRGVQNIGPMAYKLYSWLKDNTKYDLGYPPDYKYEGMPSLELEHIINPQEPDAQELLIDYYLPIKIRVEKK